MADAGRDEVAGMVLGAWDAFLDQVATVDLERSSRLPGWRAHEIAVHLGCWDDHTALADLIASARSGGAGAQPDVDAVNAPVTAAHRDATRDEVLAALRRNRDATARYLKEEPLRASTRPRRSRWSAGCRCSASSWDRPTSSPCTGWISCPAAPSHRPRGARVGIAALVDVTGALAASCDITGGVTLATPDGGWAFAADGDGWTVRRVPTGQTSGRPSRRRLSCCWRRPRARSTHCRPPRRAG